MIARAPELLTVKETMARLKYGRTKVYDLIRAKRLVSITEGRARRIPESAIQDYIQSRLDEAS
ncbi:helix-turn-helix domain-containing protein [Streptomyces kanamyceticus]|uniref:DNA-binding protein n=1 Tax=Streptomyces kanamyceticus TaxID=1967 RepID=A0A5J6GHN6_STRKN|nr:helix-turn-helix domain-containing protein [Streptomyces kanamyceticus]QEU93984.1 DNA-binding protein [Streptomyces kanamyceticus]